MPSQNATELQAAFGYLFGDEVSGLHQLSHMLPELPLVVNIGAGSGTSGLAFLESRSDLNLVTVDKQFISHPFGSIQGEQVALYDAGLLDYWRYLGITGNSIEIGEHWDDIVVERPMWQYDKVDMVFVDGDHTFEGCKGDMDAWLPNIRSGGLIAFHDYDKIACYFKMHRDRMPTKVERSRILTIPKLRRAIKPWPEVTAVVNEFMKPNYEQVLHVNSLIAFRKP